MSREIVAILISTREWEEAYSTIPWAEIPEEDWIDKIYELVYSFDSRDERYHDFTGSYYSDCIEGLRNTGFMLPSSVRSDAELFVRAFPWGTWLSKGELLGRRYPALETAGFPGWLLTEADVGRLRELSYVLGEFILLRNRCSRFDITVQLDAAIPFFIGWREVLDHCILRSLGLFVFDT
ncbi:hypothetical protein EON80_08005 [bacterium]|nr:MAG: hypothetical protein EON80_08005 [bacterium]